MLNETGLQASGRQLPQLLESQTVGLGRLTGVEAEPLDQLLRDAAAAPLAEHGDLGVSLRPQREIRSGRAILFDAHVAYGYAFDGSAFVVQGFGGGKSREYVDAQFLGFLAENGHQLSQRDDEVAVIRHLRRGGGAGAFAAGAGKTSTTRAPPANTPAGGGAPPGGGPHPPRAVAPAR